MAWWTDAIDSAPDDGLSDEQKMKLASLRADPEAPYVAGASFGPEASGAAAPASTGGWRRGPLIPPDFVPSALSAATAPAAAPSLMAAGAPLGQAAPPAPASPLARIINGDQVSNLGSLTSPLSPMKASDLYDSVRPTSQSRAPAGVNQDAWDAAMAAQNYTPGLRRLANGDYIPSTEAGYAIPGDIRPMMGLLANQSQERQSQAHANAIVQTAQIAQQGHRTGQQMHNEEISNHLDLQTLANTKADPGARSAAKQRLQDKGLITADQAYAMAVPSATAPGVTPDDILNGVSSLDLSKPSSLADARSRLTQSGYDKQYLQKLLTDLAGQHGITDIHGVAHIPQSIGGAMTTPPLRVDAQGNLQDFGPSVGSMMSGVKATDRVDPKTRRQLSTLQRLLKDY